MSGETLGFRDHAAKERSVMALLKIIHENDFSRIDRLFEPVEVVGILSAVRDLILSGGTVEQSEKTLKLSEYEGQEQLAYFNAYVDALQNGDSDWPNYVVGFLKGVPYQQHEVIEGFQRYFPDLTLEEHAEFNRAAAKVGWKPLYKRAGRN